MNLLSPGFADPVLDAQACFRAVLEAMSRPGRIMRAGSALAPPAPLHQAAAAVLLTLADADTPIWLDAGEAATAWARFHCGAPVMPEIGTARFALAAGAAPALATLDAGTDEEPQRGATLILQVTDLIAGEAWRLTGPGIEHEHRLRVIGAPDGFLGQWAENRQQFPCGVDVILCAGDKLAALPRSIMIAEG